MYLLCLPGVHMGEKKKKVPSLSTWCAYEGEQIIKNVPSLSTWCAYGEKREEEKNVPSFSTWCAYAKKLQIFKIFFTCIDTH